MSFHDENNIPHHGPGRVPPPPSPQEGERTQVFAPLDANPSLDDFSVDADALAVKPPRKGRHLWAWITLAVVVLLVAAGFGTVLYFQNRALPGTTLWGTDVTGRTRQQIADMIDDQVDAAVVPVVYGDKSAKVAAKDLGIAVDAQSIANKAVEAKRDEPVWERYAFWDKKDVAPSIDVSDADPTVLDEHLGTNSHKPVNAALTVDADGGQVTVVPSAMGSGADPEAVAREAVAVIESLGSRQPSTVTVDLQDIKPAVDDATAQQAKRTIDKLVADKVGISVGKERIAVFDAPMLVEASVIDPDEDSTLKDTQTRNGVLVFDAEKMQALYDKLIKPTLSTTKEDREVIVNGNGDEIEVIKEGHDGVRLKDGADEAVGRESLAVLSAGKGSVELAGEVDPMTVKKTKRHVVVDLSDHKVYAYENDKLVKAMSMSAGQGNDYETGACAASGDLCTPMGDFEIWLKYPSQDMSGNLTLSDGSKESWDVKDVGFVNYFSKTGCAIHRIATDSPFTDAQIAAMHANTSHGCVGIGWDAAEWFYSWCVMGTSVHVQQ